MKIVQSSATLLFPDTPALCRQAIALIERSGRTCYKSEDRITDESAPGFAKMLIDRGHHAMVEIGIDPVVRFVCDRGISHEIVRHRLASYAQESTRYCNYSKEKFGEEITVIDPTPYIPAGIPYDNWTHAMRAAERHYFALLACGLKPQMARSVLPNSLKTEVVMKANLREWRHFFALRTADAAHPQLTEITRPLLVEFRRLFPVVFDDVGVV